MREFGSDFHYIPTANGEGKSICNFYPHTNLYADGRQALIHLYQSQGWSRLWIPEYFCYDVVASLKQAGLNLCFYADYPCCKEESKTLDALQKNGYFKSSDAILRVNYFGSRAYRSPEMLPVAAVVEDHTHDIIGGWAMSSNADWCIASLRKTLPIAEGGILWSPVGLKLPEAPAKSEENERIAAIRWEAMKLKARYLSGESVEKAAFRAGFIDTEPFFDMAPVCALDEGSKEYLYSFDIQDWYKKKRDNWELLSEIKKEGVKVFGFDNYGCYPFSLVLIFDCQIVRDRVRKALIEQQIYPAILWDVPETTEGDIFKFSRGMLSIHCDARYSREDILTMKTIIESVL